MFKISLLPFKHRSIHLVIPYSCYFQCIISLLVTLVTSAPGYDFHDFDLYHSAPLLPAPVHHAPIIAPAPIFKAAPIYAPAPIFKAAPIIKTAPILAPAPVIKTILPATSYASFTQYHVSHPVVKVRVT